MELIRCSRCGSFYANGGYVCPKCASKDNFELARFKNFVEQDEMHTTSLNSISLETGISEKNLNRFLNYDGFEGYKKFFT